MNIISNDQSRQIYTVSKLTRKIKNLLEENFSFVWVTGEISNLARPASGHAYFTLKDADAVINCVVFKHQQTKLIFDLENGLHIFGMARVTLYEPRGSYQLIFEYIEPDGVGSNRLAFEQLKKKLQDQGLFDDAAKRPIPLLPEKISIITSGTGAALQDIINIRNRRFPDYPTQVISVQVQGENSEDQLCRAIEYVNEKKQSQLIIIARGGGSFEDLASFNSEKVAHAIFNSRIPIITGIGHETDFSIADFTADLRAPTPSAAAELAFQDKQLLMHHVQQLNANMKTSILKQCEQLKISVLDFQSRLKSPSRMADDYRLKLADLESRLHVSMKRSLQNKREKTTYLTSQLNSLNPNGVLDRGYSITRFLSDKKVIFNSNHVKDNDKLEIILSKGKLITTVDKTNGQKTDL